jgi:hypothetical protein
MKNFLLLFLSVISFAFAEQSVYETEHFIFNGENITEEFMYFAEHQFNEIQAKFPNRPSQKIAVNVYPDIKTLHANLDMQFQTDYVIAHRKNGKIFIVSPLNSGSKHNQLSVLASLRSGIANSFLSDYNLPNWLMSALCFYERTRILKGFDVKFKYDGIKENLMNHPEIFTLANLQKTADMVSFENNYLKTQEPQKVIIMSLTQRELQNSFIKLVIDLWGCDYLLKIENDKPLSEFFNMTDSQLEQLWQEYTIRNFYSF